MELQLVNKEIAIKLKELGFDIPDLQWYDKKGKVQEVPEWFKPHYQDAEWYQAPTQALVIKWLRDAHNIRLYIDEQNAYPQYYGVIMCNGNFIWEGEGCDTYEQAEETGIIEALKLISNETKETRKS